MEFYKKRFGKRKVNNSETYLRYSETYLRYSETYLRCNVNLSFIDKRFSITQKIINCQPIIDKLIKYAPRAILLYNTIQRYNMLYFLSSIGITNKWVIFALLLLL